MEDLIKEKLSAINLKFNKDKIALHIVEGEDYYSLCYNFMGTGIHIPVADIDEEACKEVGIAIWKTWSYKN